MSKRVIQVHEKPPLSKAIPLSIQHMFAMFGASVLVPTLFGINPAIVLLMNGLGTLFFFWITKGKAPAYLGSSFAFIGPTLIVMDRYKDAPEGGFAYAQGGFVAVGVLVAILAMVIKKVGSGWIDKLLPAAAMGPVVALIGLELSGTAASTAGILSQTNYVAVEGSGGLFQQVVTGVDPKNMVVFLVTLGIAVFGSVLFRGFLSVIPILIAIIGGYLAAYFTGIVDFTMVNQAHVFSVPHFQLAQFRLDAIITMLPVSLVLISEHIGHQIVTGKIVEQDLLKDPGLDRSLMGDGISTMASGMFGAVPTTTYGENIGVMAMTRVYSVWVLGGAAVLSIISSFIGKFSALISTIPGPVIGGISFLLYGMIGASGLRILVDSKVDFSKNRNVMMTAVVFVTGLSGASINIGDVQLKGMVLATVVGMMLGLIFYIMDCLKLTNDSDDDEEAAHE